MDNYLKILKPTTVYSHWTGSNIIKTLSTNENIRFNREKRRGGSDWIEIYLDENQKGYINVSNKNYIIYQYVSLTDDLSVGINYIPIGKEQTFDSIFSFLSNGKKPDLETGLAEFKRVDGDKKEQLYLGYDENNVVVVPIKYLKDDFLYVLPTSFRTTSPFIETDDFNGKKGILLKSTSITSEMDKFINQIGIIFAIITVVGIFLYVYSLGWIVYSGILVLIIMVVVIVITTLVFKLITSSIAELYNQIRKRL
jgi:ABC-type multidrug transport system fused ATPase/permease subunit